MSAVARAIGGWKTAALGVLLVAFVSGCAGPPRSTTTPDSAAATIAATLPRHLADRAGWAEDIRLAFATQEIPASRANACAVAAVLAQESGFQANPVIPGLGKLALREIDTRATRAGIPSVLVSGALALHSPDGRSWRERIEAARTEKDLSDVYETFIGQVPLGSKVFEGYNPIHTRGPMQVSVSYAERRQHDHPYPWPAPGGVDEVLFTRRGSIWFGVAHLLAYEAPYDGYFLYRFADYNAGQYASRNAAFQVALARVSGMPVHADGVLEPTDRSHEQAQGTRAALEHIAPRLKFSAADIDAGLGAARSPAFERSIIYRRVFAAAEERAGHALPRARLPDIELKGPKIERRLTTAWYARRVAGRFQSCLSP